VHENISNAHNSMNALLVTGASGLLGWNVCGRARRRWRVVGVFHRHPVDLRGVSLRSCDLTDRRELLRLFREVAPDAVVHCAAAAQPDYCQARADESRPINVNVPIGIADLCAGFGIPYVFTSTDLVFDGTRAPYREGDPVSPISVYGEQKVAAEVSVRARHPAATVVRLPPMFGDPGPAAISFIYPWIATLQAGNEVTLFTDEFRTPVGVGTAAEGVLMALGAGGTLHLGGRERVSRYALGLMLADLLGVDAALVKPRRQRDRTIGAPRPPDVSLDSSRAFALGYNPSPLRDALREAIYSLGRTT
jgi:dTDP-4-dehydrorhamnose reductase